MTEEKKRPDLSASWREARELVWEHRYRLAVGLTLMFFNRLLGIVLPASSKVLIDDVIGKQREELLWPLAIAALLSVSGAMLYARAGRVTAGWLTAVVLSGAVAALGAWKLVERSAAVPSTDPEDDPKYRFQGHVARVTAPIVATSGTGAELGRIVFEFDGKRHDLAARWSPEADLGEGRLATAAVDTEVVIEFIDGDVAFVEPWAVVEQRI